MTVMMVIMLIVMMVLINLMQEPRHPVGRGRVGEGLHLDLLLRGGRG